MAWPTDDTNISTTNLDSATDSPAAARADLKTALDELANVINGRDQANGVAGLDAASKISNSQLPDTITSSTSTSLTLAPDNNIVTVQNIIQLTPQTTAELNSQTGVSEGAVAFCSDAGDSAGVGIPVYHTGGQWRSMIDGTNI